VALSKPKEIGVNDGMRLNSDLNSGLKRIQISEWKVYDL
jgi:hypothetical protein